MVPGSPPGGRIVHQDEDSRVAQCDSHPWLTVPLALIGVTVGLLALGQPFGFMALLGMLSG